MPATKPASPIAVGRNNATGRSFWRSLEERSESEEFRKWVENEFPGGIAEGLRGPSRREVLKLMAASFALAGFTGCGRQPPERIVPRVRADEAAPRSKPLYFATSLTLDGYARGALVESYLGRPIKVEGNPDHPASLGATDIFGQAAILEMYDPERSQAVVRRGDIATWPAFAAELAEQTKKADAALGEGLHLLTGPTTSPTVRERIMALLERWPEARWYVYAPIGRSRTRAGAKLAFGRPLDPLLRLRQADVILSIDDDFLFTTPGHLRNARDFAARRATDPQSPGDTTMNRLYMVEPSPTVTGTNADHRLPATPDQLRSLLVLMATELGVELPDSLVRPMSQRLDERMRRWARIAAQDLKQNHGRALVTVGESQPPELHCLGHLINSRLGSLGSCVELIDPVSAEAHEPAGTVADLARSLAAGKVETLLMLDVNPAYNAPAELEFAERIKEAAWSAQLGLFRDETAACCTWHLPMAHELESWGDARAFDGTASIIQPLIGPLYEGRSPLHLLAMLAGDKTDPQTIIKRYWLQQTQTSAPGFWRETLRRGVVEGTAATPVTVDVQSEAASEVAAQIAKAGGAADTARPFELQLIPDPSIWDGRFANTGWLQELPKPVNKLTWDNAVYVSPATAKDLGVQENGQVVELDDGERKLAAPVWITPGQAKNCLTLALGFGRRAAGQVGNGVGVDAYALRTSARPWTTTVSARVTTERHLLVNTQHHQLMENRDLLRTGALEQYRTHPESVSHNEPRPTLSLYPDHLHGDPQWGMVIDLGACIGCNACVLACQAENNIPVVGKSQVDRGREMHWIRVDRYFEGDPEAPTMHHQPVPCMQCENAPCEVVCPVGATTHSKDGLNEMTYNRCIGTRYCSNNCPYKVRRFNFLNYNLDPAPSVQLSHNPDVTVRARGVMEKCTYCVQRIREAQIDARKDNRPIADGEVVTACQQVCPARAITFGNIHDPNSAVSTVRKHPLHYGLLVDLNTRPRTTYLAGLQNPNPDLTREASETS